jgi:hypothetical protein
MEFLRGNCKIFVCGILGGKLPENFFGIPERKLNGCVFGKF